MPPARTRWGLGALLLAVLSAPLPGHSKSDSPSKTDASAGPAPSKEAAPTSAPRKPLRGREVQERGKVVRYREALAPMLGTRLAGEWGSDLLALRTDDGRLLPILPTEAARFFYQDPQMLGRPMLLTAQVYAETPGLHILRINSLHDAKPYEIYYWCNVCSIRMYELKACDCCQGPSEVREYPVGETYRINKQTANEPERSP